MTAHTLRIAICAPFMLMACASTSSNPDAGKRDMRTSQDGSTSSEDMSANVDMSQSTGSAQIAAVRTAASSAGVDGGAVNLPIEGVYVTYVKPAILDVDGGALADDPAGFFVQAEQAGPAIFVAVSPHFVSPTPAVGDQVSLTANQVLMNKYKVKSITEISGFTRIAAGTPSTIDSLRVDVSSTTDLVTNIDGWDSRIIAATIRVAGVPSNSGTGFKQAAVITSGYPSVGDGKLRVRVPETFIGGTIAQGDCKRLGSVPMWRNGNNAQISPLLTTDISAGTGCVPMPSTDASVPPDAAQPPADMTGQDMATGDKCVVGQVVMSQVYGGGGNAGPPAATYKNDFIELHNVSTTSCSLAGFSLQYASASSGGASSSITVLSGSIPAGGYILIKESGGTNGIDLPTPDISCANTADCLSLGAASGQVVLVNKTTAVASPWVCATIMADPSFIDLVGYGTGAGLCYRGTGGPTGALSTILAAIRKTATGARCQNTPPDNSADFEVLTPVPYNSTHSNSCQ